MAKYLVIYTISDDEKRKQFVEKLESIGLYKYSDQSTNYGIYEGTMDALKIVLQTVRINLKLSREDKITLFYATSVSSVHTIELEKL